MRAGGKRDRRGREGEKGKIEGGVGIGREI